MAKQQTKGRSRRSSSRSSGSSNGSKSSPQKSSSQKSSSQSSTRRSSARPHAHRAKQNVGGDRTVPEQEYEDYTLLHPGSISDTDEPDVLLDVPVVNVDEIHFELDNLHARVALHAEVLDLVKLSVGVHAELGKVELSIKGGEAQALLRVRLDHVTAILDRVLTTLDRNPELVKSLGRTIEHLGQGAGGALQDVGSGAGSAVEDVGEGAGSAVEDVGEGAEGAVKDVGKGAGGPCRTLARALEAPCRTLAAEPARPPASSAKEPAKPSAVWARARARPSAVSAVSVAATAPGATPAAGTASRPRRWPSRLP